MANFSIKSVFSAVDNVTAPVKRMAKATTSFGKRTEASMKRAQLATSNYSKANSGLMRNLGMLVGAGGLLFMLSSGFRTAYNANVELDASLNSLQAITGVTGKEFNSFANEIENVSERQLIFGADTAKAFELVGSAKPELLASADALSQVTEAAIILGKAGKLETEDAVNSLTVSMNQFGAGAERASEFVDILATAQQKGAGPIKYLSEAMVNAGGTAKAFGNSFEDTVAILEGFAKAGVPASEAGTMLSGILSKLSKVQNKDFNPQFTKATDIINNLAKANLSYNDLLEMTDVRGAKWLTTIINQNDQVQQLAGNLYEAGNAQKQADTQGASLAIKMQELSDAFKNAVSSTNTQNSAMQSLKSILGFLARNMDSIIGLIVTLAKVGAAWLAVTLALNAGLKIQMAIIAVGKFMRFVRVIAMLTKAKGAWVAIQWALNAAMSANPIGIIIVAIGALVAGITILIKNWEKVWGWLNKVFDNKWARLAMFIFTPFIAIPLAIARNWEKVKETMSKVWEAIKTGVKKVGLFLFDFLIKPIEDLLKIASGLGVDMATNALKGINAVRGALGGEVEQTEEPPPESKIYNRDYVFNEQANERAQNANVMLNINNNNNSDISTKTQGAGVKVKNTSMFQ